MSVAAPAPRFDHLLDLTDDVGTFEHAEYAVPRRGHGYCTDDMARVLMVVSREPAPARALQALGRTAMRFLVRSQGVDGRTRNRRDMDGSWRDPHGVDDSWGRSVAAFGVAATCGHDDWTRQMGVASFGHAVQQRSPHLHAMSFAAIGAAEVRRADRHHYGARAVLSDFVDAIGPQIPDPSWPWPLTRLSYANATIAEALIAAGDALGRPDVVRHGCELLAWLLSRETVDGHLSPTPVAGSGPGDVPPGFDQQPIEVAAMADACARAGAVTGDASWGGGIGLAIGWFLGDNDAGSPMFDVETGGGYDGLQADGPNRNQGAESTIALISTMQHARGRSTAVR